MSRAPFMNANSRARLPALVTGLRPAPAAFTGLRMSAPGCLSLHSARVMVALGSRMRPVPNHPSGTPCTSALCGKGKVSWLPTRRCAARAGDRFLAARQPETLASQSQRLSSCLASSADTVPPAAWPDSSAFRPLHCTAAIRPRRRIATVPFRRSKTAETG